MTIGITGHGYALPNNIRTNNDPVFNWVKKNHPAGKELFQGYNQRRVLLPSQNLMTIMVPAALEAIQSAGIASKDIDVLIGYGSVSEYVTPNALNELHGQIKLPARCSVFPVANEFNNFNSALFLANSLLKTTDANHILVVVGCNWTKHMDYRTAVAVGIGDGAGAVVMSKTDAPQFKMVDFSSYTQSSDYGEMSVHADVLDLPHKKQKLTDRGQTIDLADKRSYTARYFHLTQAGQEEFQKFGLYAPPSLINQLLLKNKVASKDITLITHQASSVLTNKWNELIRPGQYINTIAELGNMTLATQAVNFASKNHEIEKDYLVILTISGSSQTMATLFSRTVPALELPQKTTKSKKKRKTKK